MEPQRLHDALSRAESVGRSLNAIVTLIPSPPRAPAGPLLGMPIAVKDMIDVAGQPRGNGNPEAMAGAPALADAEVITSLREAGAELFALSALLEYAAGAQHPLIPEARNPVDPSRTAGGSSGGSAALVGAGVCPAALGTDTGGSIRVPAHYCGVVGLKPTSGTISVDGVQALAPTLDHVGLLAVDVETTTRVFSVVSGIPPVDAPTTLRVGVLVDQLADARLHDDVRVVVQSAVDRLRMLAADGQHLSVVDITGNALDELNGPIGDIILFEAWQEHGAMMTARPEHYGAPTARLFRSGEAVDEASYRAALARRDALLPAALAVLDHCDIVIGPAGPFTAPEFSPPIDTADGEIEGIYSGPYNMTGQPAIVIPSGTASDGLPVGLQLAALPGQDALLLAAAAVIERALAVPTSGTTTSGTTTTD